MFSCRVRSMHRESKNTLQIFCRNFVKCWPILKFFVYCCAYQISAIKWSHRASNVSLLLTILWIYCCYQRWKRVAGHRVNDFGRVGLGLGSRWYHSPSHSLTVNVLLNNITLLWFLLFSMCHSLHVAVNKCINWWFFVISKCVVQYVGGIEKRKLSFYT